MNAHWAGHMRRRLRAFSVSLRSLIIDYESQLPRKTQMKSSLTRAFCFKKGREKCQGKEKRGRASELNRVANSQTRCSHAAENLKKARRCPGPGPGLGGGSVPPTCILLSSKDMRARKMVTCVLGAHSRLLIIRVKRPNQIENVE